MVSPDPTATAGGGFGSAGGASASSAVGGSGGGGAAGSSTDGGPGVYVKAQLRASKVPVGHRLMEIRAVLKLSIPRQRKISSTMRYNERGPGGGLATKEATSTGASPLAEGGGIGTTGISPLVVSTVAMDLMPAMSPAAAAAASSIGIMFGSDATAAAAAPSAAAAASMGAGRVQGQKSKGGPSSSGGSSRGPSAKKSKSGTVGEGGEQEVFEVEALLGRRIGAGGEPQYLVHWRGYPSGEDSWEPWASLIVCSDGIRAFHAAMFSDGSSQLAYAAGCPPAGRFDEDRELPGWRILSKRTASGREYRTYFGPLGEHVRSRATAIQLKTFYEMPPELPLPDGASPEATPAMQCMASAVAIAASAAAIAAANAAAAALLRQQAANGGTRPPACSAGAAVSSSSLTPSVAAAYGGPPQLVSDLGFSIGPMQSTAGNLLLQPPTTNLIGQPLPQLSSGPMGSAACGCQAAFATAASLQPAAAAAAEPPPESGAADDGEDGEPLGTVDSWTSDAEAAALADALFR